MRRSSVRDSDYNSPRPSDASPSRRARRRTSAPLPRRHSAFDLVDSYDQTSTESRVQFTPLRQILDDRTQRRIKRFGLSEEINSIQREKRQSVAHERTLHALIQERDALQGELNRLKQSDWSLALVGDRECNRPFEDEHSIVHDLDRDIHENLSTGDEEDMFSLHDNAFIISGSPDFRDSSSRRLQSQMDSSASGQVNDDAESQNLNRDLQAARQEKRDLFSACRNYLSTFGDSDFSETLQRSSSPPPGFFDNLTRALTNVLSRASEATQSLESISQTCHGMGFVGSCAEEVVKDMQSHFRASRLELERLVPGETANVGLGDGKATLGALVDRVRMLATDLNSERTHYHGSLGREKALRGQFDNLLHRFEAASSKIKNLEDTIASSAGDMLHTRMRLQQLESEDHEKSVGIDRLNIALDKYHEEVRGLEKMVNTLEAANEETKGKYQQRIADLKAQVGHERKQRSEMEAAASGNELRIRQLQDAVEQSKTHARDLSAKIEALKGEHESALMTLEQQTSEMHQKHDEETGMLNVRISDLATSLEGTRSEAQRLQQINAELENQLQLEIDARDQLLDKWMSEQARSFAFMKETVGSERRRGKVRAANWELRSDDLLSDGPSAMDSEPITPVSMTRFVDVEMGRGKNRRRMDSGIGILSEDDLFDQDHSGDCL